MLEFRGKHLIGRPAAGYPSAHDFPPHPERITSPTPTDQSKQSRSTAISTLVKIREELAGDLGCFLTGFSDLTLQVAHLVNAVRKDEINFLSSVLGITRTREGFSLDSEENLVLLYPPYHQHLDLYGTFAITPSEHSLEAIIEILEAVNQKWKGNTERYSEFPPRRDIEWSNATFSYLKFEIILLAPSHFLLAGQPLITLEGDGPRTYRLWEVNDRELRQWQVPGSDPYPPFSYAFRKQREKDVNPLLLILNAASKIEHQRRRYGLSDLTEHQRRLVDLTMEAYKLILYIPPLFEAKLKDGLYVSPTASPPLPSQASPSQQSHGSSRDVYDNNGTPSGGGAGFDENEGYDEDNSDGDSDSDGDGLTTEDVNGIMGKLGNPATTFDDRKELTLLLLFGGRSYRPLHTMPRMESVGEPEGGG
ncbi:hypothetical protein EIP91_008235 [Steccherinum ochraceum]|uniref:Uncharacterized protein n=1 Tax=Steccherinum ochraceum TaxID=92696 RepID=A0A4R0R351_9APHY|nr:hypothetical protein EIP91_008235 [Steccherinum ochraceum]